MTLIRSNKLQIFKNFKISKCSPADLLLLILYIIALFCITLFTIYRLKSRNKDVKNSSSQIEINSINSIKICISCCIIGFIGTFLGSATTMMFNIYLVSLNIDPFIASPTALFLTALTNGSSTLINFANGKIYMDVFLIVCPIILASTLVTRLTFYEYFSRKKWTSIPMLFICVIVILAIIATVYDMVPKIYQDYKDGDDIWQLGDFCSD